MMEQWIFVPRVVKELAELEAGRSGKGSISKEELREMAINCKKVYISEFDRLDSSATKKGKRKAGSEEEDTVNVQVSPDDAGFDSDKTIEMTEEEIEFACRQLNS